MKEDIIPPKLVKTEGGDNVYYKNRFLYPENNILKRIENKTASLEINNNTLIIIPSPLLFHGIEILIPMLKKNCSILFIEHDKSLFNLKNNTYRNFESFFAENENSVHRYCENFDFSMFRKIVLLPLNNGYFINRIFYNKALDIFRLNLNRYWKNKITLISLSSRWYSNIFKNLPLYFKGKSLSSLKINGPVVVAGAGESLEKSIPLLKKFRKTFTLIAIDTAVSTLFHADIKPDFILAVEAQFYNIYDFYNIRNSGIPLICDISSYPQTGRITGSSNYFFYSEFSKSAFSSMMYEKSLLPLKIPPLGSVGVIAVYIAAALTESPVIYTGLDFSFIPGKSHCKNSPFIILTSLLKNRTSTDSNYSFCLRGDLIKTTDSAGKIVFTNSSLRSYSESLAEILNKYSNIYSLFQSGLVCNKNTAVSEADFQGLLTVDPGIADNEKSVRNEEDLKYFYEREYKNIKDIISISVDFLNSLSDKESLISLRNLLGFSDYITEDFPEKSLPDEITPPYIKRVLLSCYRYERLFRNMLSYY